MPGASGAPRYIRIAAAAALAVLGAVAAVNAAVDPYGTVRLVERAGFNAVKPAVHTRVRLAKAADVLRLRPAAIVLGTSRSHVALRMSHPGWAGPRYNLGFDGATPEEMYAYLRHAHAAGTLRQVVLGLDTWQLGSGPSSVRPDFEPLLLLDGSAASRVRSAFERTRLLFSLETLAQSWRTSRAQRAAEPVWFAPDGQRLAEIFFRRPGETFIERGPGAYFADIDRLEVGFKLPAEAPARLRRADPPQGPTSFDYIRRIVAFCRAEGIDLRIFITPAHAHQMEISAAVGEWPKIESGKRALVALLAEDAAAHGADAFPLWDFSGYSSVTTEPVPPVGSRDEMRFYWDSSHFKEAVGDMVLDRIFGVSGDSAAPPEDFGRRLAPETVEAVLAEIRAGRARYRWTHPADAEAIAAMVAAASGVPAAPTMRIVGTE